MKTAIRYLRFSQIGQSNGSIERQELYTDQWLEYNNVSLVDTFVDRGHSAKTFDRPDFNKLKEFIKRYHRTVDYLVLDQFDRFSRDAGEAMSLVKRLQKEYSIQIVSVTEGIIFDYNTPGSFFRAGLQLLLAEDDNINRSVKVRGGIYTAKAKHGRYIGTKPPFGYRKIGERKDKKLVIEEAEAPIILSIYEAYLNGVPLYLIKEQAKKSGFKIKGNCAIEKILANPVYAGLLEVKPFKEYPGGLFPGSHESLIDITTWQLVQQRLKRPVKARTILDENLPLRGLLKCYCGNPLSGAPSRGKSGKYFHYYKCRHSKHNNISANKAHGQFLQVCELMSLPERQIKRIREEAKKELEKELTGNRKKVREKRRELQEAEEKLIALEEKWIQNDIGKETYQRWYGTFNDNVLTIKGAIERLSKNRNQAFSILDKNLALLGDLRFVYERSETLEKREFIRQVFDTNLYYENGVYRTPYMLPIFSHNQLIMKEKGLLILEKKGDFQTKIPLGAPEGIRTPIGGTGNHNSIH
jgi:site-specific DNA recombinase